MNLFSWRMTIQAVSYTHLDVYKRQEGFFLSRKPELNLIDAVRLIFELDVDVHILSSVLDNEFALKEKKEWLRLWLPWLPECSCHFIPYGSVKMPLSREKIAYLLDDYTRNLVHWSGVGIKFCTECNDSCLLYTSRCV